MFTPGQFAECIRDHWGHLCLGETYPRRGVIYTVRDIRFDRFSRMGLLLQEIRNPPQMTEDGFTERSFFAEWFRPLKDTALEVFRALLTPTPEQAREILFSDAEHEMEEILYG